MFTKKTDDHPELTNAINAALAELQHHEPNSAPYAAIVEQIEKLHALKPETSGKPVSHDTLFTVAGNLAGILMILNFERVHVIASKALGFVIKTKI